MSEIGRLATGWRKLRVRRAACGRCSEITAYISRLKDNTRPFSDRRRRLEPCGLLVFAENKQKLVVGAIFVYLGRCLEPCDSPVFAENKQKLVVGAIFVYLGRRLWPPRQVKNKQKDLDLLIFVYLCRDMTGKMGVVALENKQKQSVPRVFVYFYGLTT